MLTKNALLEVLDTLEVVLELLASDVDCTLKDLLSRDVTEDREHGDGLEFPDAVAGESLQHLRSDFWDHLGDDDVHGRSVLGVTHGSRVFSTCHNTAFPFTCTWCGKKRVERKVHFSKAQLSCFDDFKLLFSENVFCF